MHARRALVPVVLIAAYVYLVVARGSVPPPAELVERDLPRATIALAATDPPSTIEELRARIAEVLAREGVNGAAVALVGRDGPIWIGGVGVRDRETRVPVDGDTAFRVGSLTKSMVALGVMRLVDQGKLDLDRPLRDYVDAGIDNPWEAVAPVTLAHCLEHTAGFDEIRFNEVFTDDEELTIEQTLALNPRSRRVRWRPGTQHAYTNVGITLAARAIEVVTGERFDTWLRREIMQPLGMRDADFRRTGVLAARLATGYLDRERAAPFRLFAHRPGAALLTSATDLARLVHFWIRRGDGFPPIVSRAGLARIERTGTLPFPPLDIQYGLANYGDVSHPALARGHDGGMPGFHSSMRYFPELGVGYVLLLNSAYAFRGYFEVRSLLFSYLARGRTFAPPPPASAGTAEAPHADYYAYTAPRSQIFGFIDRALIGWRVVDQPPGIRLDELHGDEAVDLVPAHGGGYRRPHECGSSVRFTTRDDGTPVLLLGLLHAEAASWWLARAAVIALGVAFVLLQLAPLWAAGVLALGVIRRRRGVPAALVLGPAVAGLCLSALPVVLDEAFYQAVIGVAHPLTITLCALTLLFAASAAFSLWTAVRWSLRRDRPPLALRVVPMACALAATGIAVWLAANDVIGLRTWAW